jgi:hypothetical protein
MLCAWAQVRPSEETLVLPRCLGSPQGQSLEPWEQALAAGNSLVSLGAKLVKMLGGQGRVRVLRSFHHNQPPPCPKVLMAGRKAFWYFWMNLQECASHRAT